MNMSFMFREKYKRYYEKGECINMNKNSIKILGIACTILGAGITLLQQKVDGERLKETVEKEVQKQLSQQNQ